MGKSIGSVLEAYGGSQCKSKKDRPSFRGSRWADQLFLVCDEVLSENVDQLSLVLDASNPGFVKEFGEPSSKREMIQVCSLRVLSQTFTNFSFLCHAVPNFSTGSALSYFWRLSYQSNVNWTVNIIHCCARTRIPRSFTHLE